MANGKRKPIEGVVLKGELEMIEGKEGLLPKFASIIQETTKHIELYEKITKKIIEFAPKNEQYYPSEFQYIGIGKDEEHEEHEEHGDDYFEINFHLNKEGKQHFSYELFKKKADAVKRYLDLLEDQLTRGDSGEYTGYKNKPNLGEIFKEIYGKEKIWKEQFKEYETREEKSWSELKTTVENLINSTTKENAVANIKSLDYYIEYILTKMKPKWWEKIPNAQKAPYQNVRNFLWNKINHQNISQEARTIYLDQIIHHYIQFNAQSHHYGPHSKEAQTRYTNVENKISTIEDDDIPKNLDLKKIKDFADKIKKKLYDSYINSNTTEDNLWDDDFSKGFLSGDANNIEKPAGGSFEKELEQRLGLYELKLAWETDDNYNQNRKLFFLLQELQKSVEDVLSKVTYKVVSDHSGIINNNPFLKKDNTFKLFTPYGNSVYLTREQKSNASDANQSYSSIFIPRFDPPKLKDPSFTFYKMEDDKEYTLFLTFQDPNATADHSYAYALISQQASGDTAATVDKINTFKLTSKYDTGENTKAKTRDRLGLYWDNVGKDGGKYSRAYQAIYPFSATDEIITENLTGSLSTELIWILFNRQNGIGRADNVVEQKTNPDEKMDYRWEFTGKFDGDDGFKKRLGKTIKTLINDFTDRKWEKFSQSDLGDLMDIDLNRNLTMKHDKIKEGNPLKSSSGFYYKFLSEKPTKATEDDLWFVQCNTPCVPIEVEKSKFKTSLEENEKKRLEEFQFKYYRKVSTAPVEDDEASDTTPVGGDEASDTTITNENIPALQTKVIKAPDGKNRPTNKDITETDGYIGLSLPISMNLQENQEMFRNKKTERQEGESQTSIWRVIKNKGNALQAEQAPRKQAGYVMDAIRKHIETTLESKVGGSKTSLSATKFSEAVVGQPARKAQQEWQKLKQTKQTIFPTAQEWCHLLGHGDGGDERVGNFVSGSYHCNTEQLAIESGQRRTTIPADKRYILKSTAYLLDDDSMITTGTGDKQETYLNKNDKSYETNGYKQHINNNEIKEQKLKEEIEKTGKNAPIAKFIRYKIYDTKTKDAKGQPVKIFDYIFEGQSEFFDRNQYLILNYTIRYILNPDEVLEDLAQKWIEKDNQKRKRTSGEAFDDD